MFSWWRGGVYKLHKLGWPRLCMFLFVQFFGRGGEIAVDWLVSL